MAVLGAFAVPHPPIIMPQVGKGEERKIQKTIDAYREVARRIASLKPQTIILTSPHSIMYADYFHISPGKTASGSLIRFGAPDVRVSVEYDARFVEALTNEAEKEKIPAGTLGERNPSLDYDHASVIPLAFVNEFYTNYKLVRIGLSGLSFADHYKLGMCIQKVADTLGIDAVLVASGDLSHKLKEDGPYGLAPEGPEFDKQITEAFAKGDFLRFMTFPYEFAERAAECGLRSFIIMAGALDGKNVKAELLSYEGPFGVGYGVASFIPEGDDPERRILDKYYEFESERMRQIRENEDAYVRLARYSVEHFVKTKRCASLPENLPSEMTARRAGVFVSLKKHGELRGCIGTIAPVTENIAQEILRNAVSACSEDPRFEPVRADELDDLIYSVDVLSPAEPVSSPDMLDPVKYGVIVTSGRKRGLLLPNLEGVDTVEQQIDIAKRKAGIGPNEKYTLERFEVVRHK